MTPHFMAKAPDDLSCIRMPDRSSRSSHRNAAIISPTGGEDHDSRSARIEADQVIGRRSLSYDLRKANSSPECEPAGWQLHDKMPELCSTCRFAILDFRQIVQKRLALSEGRQIIEPREVCPYRHTVGLHVGPACLMLTIWAADFARHIANGSAVDLLQFLLICPLTGTAPSTSAARDRQHTRSTLPHKRRGQQHQPQHAPDVHLLSLQLAFEMSVALRELLKLLPEALLSMMRLVMSWRGLRSRAPGCPRTRQKRRHPAAAGPPSIGVPDPRREELQTGGARRALRKMRSTPAAAGASS